MRWKALVFLGKLQKDETEKYGFRSRNCPPVVDELTEFENDMQLMIKNKKSEFVNKCRHQDKLLPKKLSLKDSMD